MKYRIGLDIGIASIGWSAVETDDNGEPIRIADLGVRIFDKPENPKDGSALAVPRRMARGLRRLVRRRAHRVERLKSLIQRTFSYDLVLKMEENAPLDLLKARVDGLDRALSQEELARVCAYFVKHRGFRSSRKAGTKDKDEGVLKQATKDNSEKMTSCGYRTVGEMLLRDPAYIAKSGSGQVRQYRNKDGEYTNTFLRSDLQKEMELILDKQIEFKVIDGAFKDKYMEIFLSQRSFDEGPGKGSPYSGTFKVGECTFEKGEERAPKSSFSAEYARALERLNNLHLIRLGDSIELDNEKKELVKEEIRKSKEITFTKLRKLLGIDDDLVKFNLLNYSRDKDVKETEKAKFVSMEKSYEIRKAVSQEKSNDYALIDAIAEIISKVKNLDKQKEELLRLSSNFTDEEIEKIGGIDSVKFAHLSIKALRNILPHLEKGDKYSVACEKAGYNHSQKQTTKLTKLKGEEITDIINSIGSPVVRRSFSQTVKVINALIDKYGSPVGVNVEIARELGKTFDERRELTKKLDERTSDNERLKNRITEEFGVSSPKGMDIVKMRLYEEQYGKCAYSGKALDANRLFENNYAQVDHIIPYSRCFDDSNANKVLVLSEENQNKKDRIPYEYFGADEQRWADFEARVETFRCSYKKKRTLLRKKFDETDKKEWKERNLNDTKYVSRLVYNVINDYLQLAQAPGQRRVRAVSGGITSYVRKMWGLEKIREDGDKHHALDATVIATVAASIEQKITRYNQAKERCFYNAKNGYYVDPDGVALTKEQYDEEYGLRLKQPYEDFAEELKIRLSNESVETDSFGNVSKGIRKVLLQRLSEMGYGEQQLAKVKPVFVSRAPRRKAKGALHEDTMFSAKRIADENKIIVKKALTKLSLDKNGEIKGYWEKAKKDDPRLYQALKDRLSQFGNDAQKAFSEPFYRPNPDGTQGPLVRKVKIEEKASIGMIKKDVNGYVKNESMVRTDVFYKDGKYYCVPVYVKDVACGKIPNRAITQWKSYENWDEMDESYEFLFSLYPNDLIYFKGKKPSNFTNKQTKASIQEKEGFVYYKGIDIDSGRITACLHDNSYEGRIGIKTIPLVEKYSVDVLGNITKVNRETRETSGITKK